MPSEEEQFFGDKKQINLLKHNAANNFSTDASLEKALVNNPLSMMTQPAILDVDFSYELKNVKIDLPKVNIPNVVLMKHEVDRFRKLFQCKQQTARKSLSLEKIYGSNSNCSERSHWQNKPEVQFEEGLKTAAKILNFTCTKCKDNIRYSPNDLQKHFQLLHYGELPLYPCEMCNFSANDFQSFKQHRYTHRSSLVKCELCDDEHIYTLLDLTKHFTSKHCVNGHFQCEKCGFSTQDVGTFIQHIHRHNEIPYECEKCYHVSFTKEEFQKHHLVQTARKSLSLEKIYRSNPNCSERSHWQNKPEVQFEEGLKTAAKILNFTCTKCKDNIRYSPNDLQKHFQLLHYGELPLYPCEMCNFSANDFQSFKQHRHTHRSSLVKCELCDDEHIYTLLDLTKHFTSKHCVNGRFQCEKCGFSTQDVGTFVQHIHRHNAVPYECGKCHHVSFTKEEFQKHHLVHTSMFPFNCQYCSYITLQKDNLLKHIISLHRHHLCAEEKLEEDKCEKRIVKTPAGLKLVLRRCKMGTSKKALWRRKKISSGSDKTGEKNAQILRSVNKIQGKAEELNQYMRHVEANEDKDQIMYTEKHNFTSGMLSAATAQYNKVEDGTSYGLGLLKNTVHGPTVLVVKNNKISVPANYSAKFMGFKMVDGKQHIVIKLLPTSKQNVHLLGQKADLIKDGSTAPLLQTSDPYGLSSGAIPHVNDQSTLKNNSVHPLTSPPFSCSAPHSGKTKMEKQNDSLLYGGSVSQTVAPSNVAVGKSLNYLPMKLGSTVPTCDEVSEVGTQSNILWGSYSPPSHPQVLSPTVTNTLHYDRMKMPFFPELKMQNGGLNSNGTNNLYYSTSVDSSNEGLLSFHNYSKTDTSDNSCSIWMSTDERYKEFLSSKRVSFKKGGSESASSFSELMKGLKHEKVVSAQSNINKTYGHLNTKNNPVSSKSQSKCVVDSGCFMEDQYNGQQCLDANIHQGFENVTEKFQENASDCVNSVLMPKITSVFSLQSEQAANYLSPEINQLLQDVLKVKATTEQECHSKSNNCVKLCSDTLLSGHETGSKAFMHLKSSSTACDFERPPTNVGFHSYKGEVNTRCSTSEATCYERERQTPRTSFDSQEMDKLSRTPGVGMLLRNHTDAIIKQQLVKDKILSTTQNPSRFSPVLQEPKKTFLVQSPPSGLFVPLHLANQPGLQVISGKSLPSASSSDEHMTKGVPASFVLNKGPGMILTFSGAIGTVANVPSDSSQVLGRVASREYGKITVPASKVEGENDSFRSVRSSFNRRGCSTANDSLNSMPFKGPLVITSSSESSVKGISSVKVLSEHKDAVVGSSESVNQQEIKQKQHVYALLPDGQPAVFLKCMTPNKPVVHKCSVFQDNAHYQNCQPKKPGAMQQKLLLKIRTSASDTLADTTQSVSNSVPSLPLDNLQSLTSALAQKQTDDALILPGRLMPANASLASSNPACCVSPVEPVYSPRSAGTQLQKGSIESTQVITINNRSNFGSQKSTWSTRSRTAEVKPCLKQTRSKSSETAGVQRNKNFKRKSKGNCAEPTRKKVMLHRKCKEKNHAEVVSGSYKPRASKETVRTLKLLPFNSKQLVKCPRRNQPVVVLNHPDADVPEVVNLMKTIAKFKGHVLKVSLSRRTIEALLRPAFCSSLDVTTDDLSQKRHRTIKPISPVKERFVLKLTLKKTSKNNYQIVKTTSDNTLKAKFSCWFCGRIFDNQDNWVGHGQRHLMEATRDWNSLM